MSRLPTPGSDDGVWGEILNEYLSQSHAADGTLKTDTVGAPQLKPQSVTNAALVDGTITGVKLSDATIPSAKLQGLGSANGIATLDSSSQVPESQVPNRLSEASLDTTIDDAVTAQHSEDVVTFAPSYAAPLSGRVVFLGDSITAFNTSTAVAFHRILTGLLNGRMVHGGIFASGGFTLAQIRDTHLPQVLALNPKPAIAFICGFTNDAGDAAFDETTSRTVLLEIIQTLQDAGIRPGLWTPPPRDDSTSANLRVQRWSAWIRFIARDRGFPLIDANAALIDETTGLFVSSYRDAGDAVHPNTKGHYTIAQYAAADPVLLSFLPTAKPHLLVSSLDTSHMFTSPNRALFLAGVDGGGRPTGWAEYSATSHTGALVTSSAIPGNWWEISRLAGVGAGGGYQYDLTTGFSPGDRLYLGFSYDMVADPLGVGFRIQATLQARNAGVTLSSTKHAEIGETRSGYLGETITLPASTSQVRINFGVTGTGTIDSRVRIGQVTLVNLTALGL